MLADRAAREGDLTAASRVHNQAALIASDSGQPELARAWCQRHARAHLTRTPYDNRAAQHALEPLVNLARLHIRAGDGESAVALLDDLYQAILTRTDTTIDGVNVPAVALTSATGSHRELTRWLWGVQLADGSRALTTAGRWHDAETLLRRHNGIGRRMLDGRQVAVIARAVSGAHIQALQLLDETEPGEPWESVVTACLTAMTRPAGQPLPCDRVDALASRYRSMPADPPLAVFRTRLGLSIIDAIGDLDHPAAQGIARDLIGDVLRFEDGYAARDLLAHDSCVSASTVSQARDLVAVHNRSGLDRPLPAALLDLLEAAQSTSEAVIRNFMSARAA